MRLFRVTVPPSRVLVLAAAALALSPAAGSAAPRGHTLVSPSAARIGAGPLFIRDTALSGRAARSIAVGPSWGGKYPTASGAVVQILVSAAYPEDPAIPQRWADFLDSLAHGPELSAITIYLAPIAEVSRTCGPQALACYNAAQSLLVAPGEQVEDGVSAEAVVTHEYGHHVAAHRSNAPWAALDTGTKRWATYMQVCPKTDTGELYPGAEDTRHYALNPGEAFAEQYRVLNERRAGLTETPWDIVSQALYPDDASLAALEQDVTTPWRGSTPLTYRGSVGAAVKTRSYTVATGLDGTLRVTLRAPAKARLSVDVYAYSSRVGHAVTTPSGRTRALQANVCGTRSFRLTVSRLAGSGAFSLAVTRP
jgi:hypothetical protein